MARYRKLLVAVAAVAVLLGQVASDGVITEAEWGQVAVAVAGAFGVFQVPKEWYGKAVAAAVAVIGVVAPLLASGDGLNGSEIWKAILGAVTVAGVAVVRNADPAGRV
jgi:hypothetical protein